VILVGVTTVMVLLSWGGPQIQREAIPFVGCPADVQGEAIGAPRGTPKVVALDGATARAIAYYQGDSGTSPGVFAPRGWHCRIWAGSAGSTMLVTPASIDSTTVRQPKSYTDAVEIVFLDGGTSGRFGVARIASRLFPRVAAKFVERVKSEGLEPAGEFARGPYPNDSVSYSDSLMAEFTTPARKTGLGTEGTLGPSQDAIRGIAVLCASGDWGMTILRVRLGPNTRRVELGILGLNKAWMQRSDGC
jgi:hypothetical protein